MNIGNLLNRHGMLAGDGQILTPVFDEATTQQVRIDLEFRPAKTGLDRDFPQVHGTAHKDVLWGFHECLGIGREFSCISAGSYIFYK